MSNDLPNEAVAKCAAAIMRLFKADACLIVVVGGKVGQTIEYLVTPEALADWKDWAPKALRQTAAQIETDGAEFVATVVNGVVTRPGQS